jgi:hypothetical protein
MGRVKAQRECQNTSQGLRTAGVCVAVGSGAPLSPSRREFQAAETMPETDQPAEPVAAAAPEAPDALGRTEGEVEPLAVVLLLLDDTEGLERTLSSTFAEVSSSSSAPTLSYPLPPRIF